MRAALARLLGKRRGFVFHDEFSGGNIDRAKWAVTDTESKLSVSGGKLSVSGGKASPSFGDPGLLSVQAWTQAAGLALEFEVTPALVNQSGEVGWNSDNDVTTDPRYGFRFRNSGIWNINNAGTLVVTPLAYAAAVSRTALIVMDATTVYYYVSGVLVWTRTRAVVTSLKAQYRNHAQQFTSDFCLVYYRAVKPPAVSATPAAPTLAYGATGATNGEFTSATTGWTADNSATLTQRDSTVTPGTASGGADNGCLEVTNGGVANAQATQMPSLVAGTWYRVDVLAYAPSANTQVNGAGMIMTGYLGGLTRGVTAEDVWQELVVIARSSATASDGANGLRCTSSTLNDKAYFDRYRIRAITLSSMLSGSYDPGTKYAIYDRPVTVAANYHAGLVCCADSLSTPANYLQAYVDRATGKAYLLKVASGTTTDLTSGNITYSAAAQLRLVIVPGTSGLSNAQVGLFYAGVAVGTVQTVDLSSGYGTLAAAFDTSGAATGDVTIQTGIGV